MAGVLYFVGCLVHCFPKQSFVFTPEWGNSVVTALAKFIQKHEPEIKGFSDKNIWRMKQFYETYKDFPKLSPLVREISWPNNLLIFSRCKTIEEMEFYL